MRRELTMWRQRGNDVEERCGNKSKLFFKIRGLWCDYVDQMTAETIAGGECNVTPDTSRKDVSQGTREQRHNSKTKDAAVDVIVRMYELFIYFLWAGGEFEKGYRWHGV